MRLTRMAFQLRDRLANGEQRELCPEEFIALLVEYEYPSRRQKRLDRLTARALRYPLLFEEVNTARGTGQYLKFLQSMSKTNVLLLDDFLMQQVSVQDLSPLMDVIEEKQQTGSIIITTQYPQRRRGH